MADRYVITGAGVAGTTVSAGAVLLLVQRSAGGGGAVRRLQAYDLLFGTTSTAADNQLDYYLQRHTAYTTGSGTAVTAQKLDPAAPAATGSGVENPDSSTVTAGEIVLRFGANQRSTQRWVASPGGELTVAVADDDGFTFASVHASANPTVAATIHFVE